ncbi:MAG: hypothetical protein GY949_11045 [Gammaproteobacteria bacterium]|nr:hypothetical protein [Gammaproteobacteria bacterium]
MSGNVGTVNLNNVDLVAATGSTGTAFAIDAGGASTGAVNADAASDLDATTGTVVSIGTGARNVTISGAISATGNTEKVIDIDGQSGGTTTFADVTINNASGAAAIESTGQMAGATLTFGTVDVGSTTAYSNATGTAVDLQGTGGAVNFTELDIVASDGDGLAVGGQTLAITNTTNDITANSGKALDLNGTVIGSNVTFGTVTSTDSAAQGIEFDNTTGAGTLTITTSDINNAGTDGIDINSAANTIVLANVDIDTTGDDGLDVTAATNLSAGTGASGLAIDDTALVGIAIRGANTTINLGTGGASGGVQIGASTAAGNHGISLNGNSTGTVNIGTTNAVSSISAGGTDTGADGIFSTNSDATATATRIDINQTGTAAGGHGVSITDDDTTGSFTLTGTNTIDNTGGDGINISGASASISGVTIGATTAPVGNGVDIAHNGQNITVALDSVTVTNAGAAGDGINIDGTGVGTITVTQFSNIAVAAAAAGNGVVFNTVTFDEDGGTAGGGDADFTGDTVGDGIVTNLNIGQGTAVGLAGLLMSNVSGDLEFDALNIASTGTGLDITGTGSFNAAAGTGFRLTTASGTINSSAASGVLCQRRSKFPPLAGVNFHHSPE